MEMLSHGQVLVDLVSEGLKNLPLMLLKQQQKLLQRKRWITVFVK
jgi:hypothetical protein